MLLRVIGPIAIRFSGRKLVAGDQFTADESDAERFIANGYAEPIDEPAGAEPIDEPTGAESIDEPTGAESIEDEPVRRKRGRPRKQWPT